MKINLTSVLVNDQARALQFYTEVLGFIKKTEIPDIRWLTVVSPEGPQDIELLLEPNENPAGKTYQEAIYKQGIPFTAFAVDNLQSDYERLERLGVVFKTKPMQAGGVIIAAFDDTCGNFIQLYQVV